MKKLSMLLLALLVTCTGSLVLADAQSELKEMLKGKKDGFVRLKVKTTNPKNKPWFEDVYLSPNTIETLQPLKAAEFKNVKDQSSIFKLKWRFNKTEKALAIGLISYSKKEFLLKVSGKRLTFPNKFFDKSAEWFLHGESLDSFSLSHKKRTGLKITVGLDMTGHRAHGYLIGLLKDHRSSVVIFSMEIIDPESEELEPIMAKIAAAKEEKERKAREAEEKAREAEEKAREAEEKAKEEEERKAKEAEEKRKKKKESRRARAAFLASKVNIADIKNQRISIRSAFNKKYFRPSFHNDIEEWVIKADSTPPIPFNVYPKKWFGKHYIALKSKDTIRSRFSTPLFLESNKWGRKKYITLFSREKIFSARELWSIEGTYGSCRLKNLRTKGYLSLGDVKKVKLPRSKKTTISKIEGRISKIRNEESELIIEKYPAKY